MERRKDLYSTTMMIFVVHSIELWSTETSANLEITCCISSYLTLDSLLL